MTKDKNPNTGRNCVNGIMNRLEVLFIWEVNSCKACDDNATIWWQTALKDIFRRESPSKTLARLGIYNDPVNHTMGLIWLPHENLLCFDPSLVWRTYTLSHLFTPSIKRMRRTDIHLIWFFSRHSKKVSLLKWIFVEVELL